METQKAILKIAEVLDVLVGNFVPDCGGDLSPGTFYCKGCKFYSQCKQMTKARDLYEELQSLLTDKGPVHIWENEEDATRKEG